MLDTVTNAAIFLFWHAIWTRSRDTDGMNPLLAPFHGLSSGAVRFLRPVLPFLPPAAVATVATAFVLVFRAFLFHGMNAATGRRWVVPFGFDAGAAGQDDLPSCLAFSGLSFGIFLFRVWGFSLAYIGRRAAALTDHAHAALHRLCRPFSDLPPAVAPFVLLAAGIALVSAMPFAGLHVSRLGGGSVSWGEAPTGTVALRLVISALAAWVELLNVWRSLVLVLIIGSWVSMFSISGQLIFLCREWLDTLMGPLRRYPIRVGMLDLTPLAAILLVQFVVHPLLIAALAWSYARLG
jgi:uncharacterized protein YggT (Ycf19 family)